MELLLTIFAVHGLLGAYDTIYHHEISERLAWRPTAAKELKLHGVRNLFYAIVFLSLGWIAWQGIFAWVFAFMLVVEATITLMDFVEEDRSRKLSATERVTHTVLTLNYGVILTLFAPILWQWSHAPNGFSIMNFGLLSWIMALYAISVFLLGCRDLTRSLFWSGKTKETFANIEALKQPNQHILITGGTGFIGKPLCQALINQGHKVTVLTRDMKNAAGLFKGRVTLLESLDLIHEQDVIDVIINLAGEPISQRWTTKSQIKMRDSRIKITEEIITLIARLIHKPSVFISGSAIGIYGTDEVKSFSEETPASDDPTGAYPRKVCEEWEAAAKKAEKFSVRTCLLRTGIVLEMDGGALAQMLFPFDFGLGGPMGSGKQWFSWIHRDDMLRLIVHIINNKNISGPINATAPEPVTNKIFSNALGKAMSRPTIIPLPAFQVKLLFGQMGEALLLAGQKVLPTKALESGFTFNFSTITPALQKIFMKMT